MIVLPWVQAAPLVKLWWPGVFILFGGFGLAW
jgi:hypothetical protein